MPTELRSDRRGAGVGWEARVCQSSSTERSTEDVILSRIRDKRFPVGMPWESLRAPCLGARKTNFGKRRKRRKVSQEGLSRSRTMTLARASAHCVRQPLGTWRSTGVRSWRMESGVGRWAGRGSSRGVGGRGAGPATGEAWVACGGRGWPLDACWARSLRSAGSRCEHAWPGHGRSRTLRREQATQSQAARPVRMAVSRVGRLRGWTLLRWVSIRGRESKGAQEHPLNGQT